MLLSKLFSYKQSLARSPIEDFLSECFAEWLRLATKSGLLPRIQKELLRLPPDACLEDLASCLKVEWSTQHVIGPGYRGTGKRPDIVGTSNQFFLIIENKIGAPFTEYTDEYGYASQLDLYKDYQQAQDKKYGGITLVTHWTSPPEGWHASVTWRSVHQWLIRLFDESMSKQVNEDDCLAYWTRNLIQFLEEYEMNGTKIELGDIVVIPAYKRLQEGMRALSALGHRELRCFAEGQNWHNLKVPHGGGSGDFVEPHYYGQIMTPSGIKAPSSNIILWAGILAAPAYEVIRPSVDEVPELSVGLGVWANESTNSQPDLNLNNLQNTLNAATPNMVWSVVWEENVLLVRTAMPLLSIYQQTGGDFWDGPVSSFFRKSCQALLENIRPYWNCIELMTKED